MITMSNWRTGAAEEINIPNDYDIAFTNHEVLDDRTDWTTKLIQKSSSTSATVGYRHSEDLLYIDNEPFKFQELDNYALAAKKVLVDSTCLRIPELLYLFSILKKRQVEFDVLYLQPDDYQVDRQTNHNDQSTQTFQLSDDEGFGVRAIPGFVWPVEQSNLLIALGFESHRFGFLLESDQFQDTTIEGIVGIPAFKPGWENRTLSNNYKQIQKASDRKNKKFYISGANDPYLTYLKIKNAHQSVKAYNRKYNHKKDTKFFHLAPFGTKPMSVAMAWYAVENEQVGVVYDFLNKKSKRSHGTQQMHLWQFESAPT